MSKPKPRKRRRRLRIDWNGCPPLPLYRRKLRRAARIAIKQGCYITATTNGVHSATSYHYRGRAIDFGSNDPQNGPEKRAQQRIYSKFGARKLTELFGPKPFYVKDGVRISARFPDHGDHTHCAI